MNVRLRHKTTGLYAIGTFERLCGCAQVSEFEVTADGELEPEYDGETEVWWDNQATETDAMTNELLLVDENEDIFPANEFERVPVDAT